MNILCRLSTIDWRLEDQNILELCLHQTVALYDNLDSNQTRRTATKTSTLTSTEICRRKWLVPLSLAFQSHCVWVKRFQFEDVFWLNCYLIYEMYFSFVGFVFLPLSTTAGCPGRNWYFSPSIKTIFQPCLASRCFDSEYLGWLVSTFSKIFFNKNINLKKSFYWPFLLQNIIISEDAKLNWTKNPKCQAELNRLIFNMIKPNMKKINNSIYIFFKSPNWFVIKRILCQNDF